MNTSTPRSERVHFSSFVGTLGIIIAMNLNLWRANSFFLLQWSVFFLFHKNKVSCSLRNAFILAAFTFLLICPCAVSSALNTLLHDISCWHLIQVTFTGAKLRVTLVLFTAETWKRHTGDVWSSRRPHSWRAFLPVGFWEISSAACWESLKFTGREVWFSELS